MHSLYEGIRLNPWSSPQLNIGAPVWLNSTRGPVLQANEKNITVLFRLASKLVDMKFSQTIAGLHPGQSSFWSLAYLSTVVSGKGGVIPSLPPPSKRLVIQAGYPNGGLLRGHVRASERQRERERDEPYHGRHASTFQPTSCACAQAHQPSYSLFLCLLSCSMEFQFKRANLILFTNSQNITIFKKSCQINNALPVPIFLNNMLILTIKLC